MSSGFNPATIPQESDEQGGQGSGRWEQNEVLDYVRQFNNAVLSAGPRPGIVSRNRQTIAGIFLGANETLQLTDSQLEIARGFFEYSHVLIYANIRISI